MAAPAAERYESAPNSLAYDYTAANFEAPEEPADFMLAQFFSAIGGRGLPPENQARLDALHREGDFSASLPGWMDDAEQFKAFMPLEEQNARIAVRVDSRGDVYLARHVGEVRYFNIARTDHPMRNMGYEVTFRPDRASALAEARAHGAIPIPDHPGLLVRLIALSVDDDSLRDIERAGNQVFVDKARAARKAADDKLVTTQKKPPFAATIESATFQWATEIAATLGLQLRDIANVLAAAAGVRVYDFTPSEEALAHLVANPYADERTQGTEEYAPES